MSITEQFRMLHRESRYPELIESAQAMESLSPEAQLLMVLAETMLGQRADKQALLLAMETEADNLDWKSDLALAHILCGNIPEAQELLEVVLASGAPGAVDYSRMAAVMTASDNLELARHYYQEAVHREPGRDIWYANLASIQTRLMEYDEALQNYELALEANPENPQAKQGRATLLASTERIGELIDETQKLVDENPGELQHKIILARLLNKAERVSEAIATLRELLVPEDDLTEQLEKLDEEGAAQLRVEQCALLTELAHLWQTKNRWGYALANYGRLGRLIEDPEDISARYGQIDCLIELRRFEEAEEVLSELEELRPDGPGIKIQRSHLLCETERYKEAEVLLRDLVAEQPANPTVLTQLANTLLWLGHVEEAADYFEKASEYNPLALASVVRAGRLPEDEKTLERMSRMADNRLLAEQARAGMSFALAEAYGKLKSFDRAFHYLQLGNDIENKGLNFEPAQFSKRADAIIDVFDKDFFAALEPIGKPDRTPIFVVGMPRSGTTLTEQVLCSHPEVFGAGELSLVGELVRLMPKVLKTGKGFPRCMSELTAHLREEAARFYLYGLKAYDEEHHYVVDKLPHNFANLGLIAAIFPTAKIIHVQRDPRDNALSNYQQNFKAKHGGMGYAFDLKNIALQINDYYRLMDHWREVLPTPIFEFGYEELVEDQEGMTREMLEFVGVEWDDKVKNFHENERAVRTASVTQVRQPIYKTSRQKWKAYEPWLGELLANLSDRVLNQWNHNPEAEGENT